MISTTALCRRRLLRVEPAAALKEGQIRRGQQHRCGGDDKYSNFWLRHLVRNS
jgi:hypothetical protein